MFMKLAMQLLRASTRVGGGKLERKEGRLESLENESEKGELVSFLIRVYVL